MNRLPPLRKKTYSISAPNTNNMHASIQASMAVSPSALGVLVVTVLKMFTSTRNSVTSNAIRPGMTSMGMRKEIQDTITKSPINTTMNEREAENAVHQKWKVFLVLLRAGKVYSPKKSSKEKLVFFAPSWTRILFAKQGEHMIVIF